MYTNISLKGNDVVNAASLTCRGYGMSHVPRHSGSVHTMPHKFENGTPTVKTKQNFSVHTWKRIKCSASTRQRLEATKTLKCTSEHAHIEALGPPWSRLSADFSSLPPYLNVVTLLFTRKRLLSFLIYPACQALRIILRKKKTKPNTFHGLMTRWNCCWMSQATTKLRRPLISLIHVIKCDI